MTEAIRPYTRQWWRKSHQSRLWREYQMARALLRDRAHRFVLAQPKGATHFEVTDALRADPECERAQLTIWLWKYPGASPPPERYGPVYTELEDLVKIGSLRVKTTKQHERKYRSPT